MQGFYMFQQIKTLFQIMDATEDLFCVLPTKNITKDMKNYLQNELIYSLMMLSVRIRNNNE